MVLYASFSWFSSLVAFCIFGVDMELLSIFAMLEIACFSFCRAFARIFLFAMLLHAFLFGSTPLLLEI